MFDKNERLKKVIILGGGLSGCVIGYLLKQDGFEDITIIEREDGVGGLCRTYKIGDNKYEFGPHIFHSDKPDVNEMIKKLMVSHNVKPIVKSSPFNDIDNLFDYPLTISNILHLKNCEDVIFELYNLNPRNIDDTSFETYVKSMIGEILYDIFIKNYNKKQWGIHPKDMSAKWAPKRISFRRDNKFLFHNMWSIYPTKGYSDFFEKLTKNINILHGDFKKLIIKDKNITGVELKDKKIIQGDIFISTIPIDLLLNSKEKLLYRGIYKSFIQLKRKKLLKGLWYTFPNHYNFTRIMEYKGYTLEENDTTILSAAFPFSMEKIDSIPVEQWDNEFKHCLKTLFKIKDSEIITQFGMNGEYAYPLITEENEQKFMNLIKKVVTFENLYSLGRLGLFIYIPMYVCIKQAIRMKELMSNFKNLTELERIQKYLELR